MVGDSLVSAVALHHLLTMIDKGRNLVWVTMVGYVITFLLSSLIQIEHFVGLQLLSLACLDLNRSPLITYPSGMDVFRSRCQLSCLV